MRTVEMIPVDRIHTLNPRVRNRKQHQEIIENIGRVGLKRPITVTRRSLDDGTVRYDLVCGQGRVEAFQALGHLEIPAFVIDAKEDECLVMSLVENIARRQHSAMDLMREVGTLNKRGYSEAQIAEKIGVTASWVSMILGLLENGEERLVMAVEAGLIPISLATDIARAEDGDVQRALADAYTQGVLKGKKIAMVRRLLDRRARHGKTNRVAPADNAGRGGSRKVTAEQLLRVYHREVEKRQVLVKKADFVQSRLLFVVEALRQLTIDDSFVALLKHEGLENIPRVISERMTRGAQK